MQKYYKQEAGFTLIEILIVLAVMGVVSTAIYNVHLTGWKAWKFNQEQLNLHQKGRIAMMKMVKGVKEAIKIKDDNLSSWPKNKLIFKWEESGGSIEFGKYWIDSYILYYKHISASDVSGLNPNEDWPSNTNWQNPNLGKKQPITTKIVKDIKFNDEHRNTNGIVDLVKMDLEISDKPTSNEGEEYLLSNRVHLRNAK